jgi:HAD superfamily hydrolase (TIGR01509 family)
VTSPPVDDPETLRRILGEAEALFLDFDGPICDVFAGLPAQVVVDQLCVVLADGGYGDPPPEIAKSSDPFDVLKYAASLGEDEGRYVNAALTALEVEAIGTAEPTPGAHAVMAAWSQTGRPQAIVSNNSTTAIDAYLDLHSVRPNVACVSARAVADPTFLKPSPYLLQLGLSVLHLSPGQIVFVGDSLADVEAASSAGVMSIGYANKVHKMDAFVAAGPGAIITSLSRLLEVISAA